jgi:Tfp pilus assembly protein PilW
VLVTALRRLRARLSGEEGFTLIELMTAMVIGMIIIFAAMTFLQRSFAASNEVADRTDAAQRGRIAMDDVTRQLGSQVCFSGTLPLISGSPTSMTFVTDLGDGTASPERHTLSFVAGSKGFNLTESDYSMTSVNGATPVTWSSTPVRTKTLIRNVAQDGSTPFFAYRGYDGTASSRSVALNSTLATADLDNVTQIVVTFTANPAHSSSSSKRGSVLSELVAVPQADPNLTDPNKTSVAATC